MSEFEDKLNAILSSPEAMGQIMALANSLGGGQGNSPPPQEGQETPPEGQEPPSAAPPSPPPDLSALLSAFSGNAGGQGAGGSSPALGGLDPALLANLTTLLREYNRNDDQKTALLLALRPFLREERWAKVDKAVQIARLSRVIRVALELFKGGEPDV